MAEWTNTKPLEALCHEYEIHWTTPYARVIEYGCSPHPVSEEGVRAIERWAQRKVRQNYTTKTGNERKRKLKETEAREMAEAVDWFQAATVEIIPDGKMFIVRSPGYQAW